MTVFKLNPPPVSLIPGSKVFAYLRDSGHETQELSTIQQKNSLEEWAKSHGLEISRFFIDDARRGSTIVGRDQLQELMHELRQGSQQASVIVWSYNRFSRGLDDPVLYRAEIRTLGYAFHSLTDDVPEGPIGRIVEAVIDYKNYQYLVDLSIDIRRGQRNLVQVHGCIPGTPPRGFMRVPVTLGARRDGSAHVAHRWEPDPDTSPLVLKAFQMRAAGSSLFVINAETRLFGSLSSYASFWRNKLYIGTLQFADITVENYCSAIVPVKIWKSVQKMQDEFSQRQHLNSERFHPQRIISRYILSGMLRCARCGESLSGCTTSSRGKRDRDTYTCAGVRKHTCTARRIPRDFLEDVVIETIKKYILDDKISLELERVQENERTEQAVQAIELKRSVSSQLKKIQAKLKRIGQAIAESGYSKTLFLELENLERQETEMLSSMNCEEQSLPRAIPATSERNSMVVEAAINLLKNGSLEEKRDVLRGLVNSIKVENIDKKIKIQMLYYQP
jgi:site-specific DNA recombinase